VTDVEVIWHPVGCASGGSDGVGCASGASDPVGRESGASDGVAQVPVLPLGEPSGPPVVLVPGLTDGLHPVSRPTARRLFDELPVPMDRCRGLVVSYRHPLDEPTSTAALAEDLAEVLDAMLAAPAVLIAHSMGTMVAQHLAARRRDLVAGMVLSAPLVEVDPQLREVLERWADLVRARRWDRFAEEALRASYTGGELERRRELAGALPPDVPDDDLRRRHLALTAACLGHDSHDLLASIRAPTLVLAAEEDPVAPPWHARRIAQGISGARLHVLPGLAHGFPEQAAPHFTSLVTSVFGDVAGSCAGWVGSEPG
jgi:pimeloyl-ACP methyl ester carboxylesterase